MHAQGPADSSAPNPFVPHEEVVGSGGGTATPAAQFVPGPLPLRRLLARQYASAIGDLLGPAAQAAVTPPDDLSINGSTSIGAAQLAIASEHQVDQYERSAFAAARAAIARTDKAALIGCTPASNADATCLDAFVERFGKKALRRPLTDGEKTAIIAVATQAGTKLNSFDGAIEFAIAALLQLPDFIYLVELGADQMGARKLTGYEMAARMSFFMLGTTPSDALLAAAESGQLDTGDGVRAHARTLLSSPRAKQAVEAFFDELLELPRLDDLAKDPALFPSYAPSLANAMRDETHRLLEAVVWEHHGSFGDALDAPFTFVNAELAGLYGLSGVTGTSLSRVALPSGPRAGLLGQGSFLSINAHVNATSPTLRGRFVRLMAMCQAIPPPPANVSTKFADDPNAKTARQRLAVHQADPACSGCHSLTDGLGLALENFDAIGRYRTTEEGVTIDPNSSDPLLGSFGSPRELGQALKAQPSVAHCFTRHLFRAATGHLDTQGEQPSLEYVTKAGTTTQDALVELVGSAAFRYGRMEN